MNHSSQHFTLAGRRIGPGEPAYCIAEVGINHNGDLSLAKRMIEVAKDIGADAVKFQTFHAEEFCGNPGQMFTYKSQGRTVTEPMLEMFRRYEFTNTEWREIKRHSDNIGITFFSTPQNYSDLELLQEIGVPAIKVGSDDFINVPLLRSYAKSGLPLILSCGMSDLAEVYRSLDCVGAFDGYPAALLLCTSQYPTPPEDVNLRKLQTLRASFPGIPIGFSDHTLGPLASSLAAALGACIFERHFTIDQGLPGPDHWFSDEPNQLREWVTGIRQAQMMLGSPLVRPTPAELEMRVLARRSVVALRDIPSGEKLSSQNIGVRRPGGGLPPEMLPELIGLRAGRRIVLGSKLTLWDIAK